MFATPVRWSVVLAVCLAGSAPADLSAQRTVDLTATAPDGVVLAGSLHLPKGTGPFATVILVHGSEPGQRANRGYGMWIDAIVGAGYACLVVDKRGVGESGGEYVEAPELTVPAADFLAWIAVAKRQPDVRRDAIGLLGWSQAGWVAPLSASQTPDVAFLVIISGAAMSPLEQNIYDKSNRVLRGASSADDSTRARRAVRAVMSYLVLGEGQAEAEAAWAAVSGEPWFTQGYTGVPMMVRADLLGDPRGRSFAVHNAYDPEPAWRAVTIPVLAIFGGADRIVPAERSATMMRASIGRPDLLQTRIIPGADHGLGVRNAAGVYGIDPSVQPMVFAWLAEVVK